MYSHQVCFCGWVSHGLRIYSLGGNDQSGMGHRERKWLETREAAGFNSVSAPFLIPFLQESLWAACQRSFSTTVMHSLMSCLWHWSLRATWAVLSLVRVCVGTVTALSTSSSSSAKKLCFLASHITPPMTFWSILHISTVLITVLVFFMNYFRLPWLRQCRAKSPFCKHMLNLAWWPWDGLSAVAYSSEVGGVGLDNLKQNSSPEALWDSSLN